jgi:hypothetical protein
LISAVDAVVSVKIEEQQQDEENVILNAKLEEKLILTAKLEDDFIKMWSVDDRISYFPETTIGKLILRTKVRLAIAKLTEYMTEL